MLRRPWMTGFLLAVLLCGALVPAFSADPQSTPLALPGQPTALSFFGINGYFTGYERSWNEVDALLPLGPAVGMRWTREELVWVNIEPHNDEFHFEDFLDDRIWLIANAGYGVIGMLLTTPAWARKSSCAGNYWCPPRNPSDYYDFVHTVVERYDGDGVDDSPGSPRVDYWELWNEPNDPNNWLGTPAEYAALLHAGYNAVHDADPTAMVLVGSVYVFDGVSGGAPAYDGLVYLSSVLQADPTAWNAFDILGIHPHMPDAAPDKPGLSEQVTMLARMQHALDWVQQHGGSKPVFVTEVGWSTCTAGQGDCTAALAMTEDQQADYLVRTHAMALAKGIPHVSTFQLEDKFDGSQSKVWGGCAIVKPASQGYAPKLAYYALGVMADQLGTATYTGPGPLHGLLWRYEDGRQLLSALTRFDYRFTTPSGDIVDIIWRPDDTNETVSFPVEPNWLVTWVSRDGQETPLSPVNGYVSITINGHPGYLRQTLAPQLHLSPGTLGFFAGPGLAPQEQYLAIANIGGGTLSWTLAIASGPEYFGAEPLTGSAPATVVVRATPPVSATGLFTGTLLVDAGAAGQGTVTLWLRVAPALWRVYLPLVP